MAILLLIAGGAACGFLLYVLLQFHREFKRKKLCDCPLCGQGGLSGSVLRKGRDRIRSRLRKFFARLTNRRNDHGSAISRQLFRMRHETVQDTRGMGYGVVSPIETTEFGPIPVVFTAGFSVIGYSRETSKVITLWRMAARVNTGLDNKESKVERRLENAHAHEDRKIS